MLTSHSLDEALGASVFFKCENFQRVGAFKFRGAFNALSCLAPAARARGVIAFSSGNHAQAVALAGRMLGIGATIVMPRTRRPRSSRRRAGTARVVIYDRYREDREEIAEGLARTGAPIIPPYDHPDIVAGQGTAAAELSRKSGRSTACSSAWAAAACWPARYCGKALAPACKVYGVEPEAGNDGQRSLRREPSCASRFRGPSPTAPRPSLGNIPSRSFGAT